MSRSDSVKMLDGQPHTLVQHRLAVPEALPGLDGATSEVHHWALGDCDSVWASTSLYTAFDTLFTA